MRKDLWPRSWQGQRETMARSLTLAQSYSFIPSHHSSLLPLPLAIGGLGNKNSWAGNSLPVFRGSDLQDRPGLPTEQHLGTCVTHRAREPPGKKITVVGSVYQCGQCVKIKKAL